MRSSAYIFLFYHTSFLPSFTLPLSKAKGRGKQFNPSPSFTPRQHLSYSPPPSLPLSPSRQFLPFPLSSSPPSPHLPLPSLPVLLTGRPFPFSFTSFPHRTSYRSLPSIDLPSTPPSQSTCLTPPLSIPPTCPFPSRTHLVSTPVSLSHLRLPPCSLT